MKSVIKYMVQRWVKLSFMLGACSLLCVPSAFAQQDAMYHQYMFNQAVINPAAAGIGKDIRAVLLYKRQWVSFPGAPRGQSFSIDGPLGSEKLKKKLGGGLHLVADRFGPNKNSGVFGSASYRLNLGKQKISFGLRAGIKQYAINWSAIEYASGYNAAAEHKNSTIVPTFGIGTHYFSKRFYFGMVFDNLGQPELKLRNTGDKSTATLDGGGEFALYRTFLMTTSYTWEVDERLDIIPSIYLKAEPYKSGDFRVNVNFMILKKFWLGAGVTEVGANLLLGANIKNLMVGLAFSGGSVNSPGNLGSSHEIIVGYNVISSKADIKLHLVSEDSSVVMIAKQGKDGHFYFEELPDQHSFIFKLASRDEAMIDALDEVQVHYKNAKGEDAVISVSKDSDKFFRYAFLPPIEEEKLFAVNEDGDTVGVAIKNDEGYFVFEYLPNDRNLIFIQGDDIADADMLITVMINDKKVNLAKGEDKYFRFEALPPEVVMLYLLSDDGDTLASGGLNDDGFFVFEKLPIDENYLFYLDARDVDLIDEVQIIQLDKQGKDKVITLAKGEGKFFKFEYLEHEESKLYMIGANGDTLMSTMRNEDGFFVFEKLPIGQNVLFMLDGEEVALIDDILIITKDKKGKDKVLTAAKEEGNKFRFESLPSNAKGAPGLLEEDEVAFIMNTNDQRILRTTYESLKFNTGEAIIALESYVYMQALSKMLMVNKDWRIILSGFTDNVGADNYNLLLSKQRAETVKRALVKRGVPAKQVRVKFYGESHPLASNDTEEGRSKNRRVEMRIVKVKK